MVWAWYPLEQALAALPLHVVQSLELSAALGSCSYLGCGPPGSHTHGKGTSALLYLYPDISSAGWSATALTEEQCSMCLTCPITAASVTDRMDSFVSTGSKFTSQV